MTGIVITLQELRDMVGTCVQRHGVRWKVVEVLEDGPELVLMNLCNHRIVQTDQYGDGYRRVLEHITVPVMNDEGTALHPEFLTLEQIPE